MNVGVTGKRKRFRFGQFTLSRESPFFSVIVDKLELKNFLPSLGVDPMDLNHAGKSSQSSSGLLMNSAAQHNSTAELRSKLTLWVSLVPEMRVYRVP